MKRILLNVFLVGVTVLILSAVADGANTGIFQAAGDTAENISAIIWKIIAMALLTGLVAGLAQLGARVWLWGIITLCLTVTCALVVYVVYPSVADQGVARGATLEESGYTDTLDRTLGH
jgi:hypothetical protein